MEATPEHQTDGGECWCNPLVIAVPSGETPLYAPPPITGYRELSQFDVNAMNEVKDLAIKVGEKVAQIQGVAAHDQRWAAIAKTDLQTGFMALIRAIAQPETF